ncbi:type 1 fimbrial protein [Klebsiella sp. HSTU-Sny5]|nr:type 1 fimbrial protein [Klebsiella sp. HSTU-Sny5]HCI5982329.1 type 1 fimbrial protein [Klebsiella quasipneumoniae subsp. quasipneumoniae]
MFAIKKKAVSVAIVSIISSLSFAASAAPAAPTATANGGTINFTGKVTDVTCTVKVNGGTNNGTVALPPVSTASLAKSGDVAGMTSFTVSLDNCKSAGATLAAGKTAAVFFEAGADVDSATGLLLNHNTSGAGAVALELVDNSNSSHHAIIAGDAAQQANTTKIAIDPQGTTILPYAVRYHATGAATAGDVESSVVYSVMYN